MNILISVIVPVYNVEPYLDRCIQSIINQTYSYLEIILVNDGSSDSSGSICDNYALSDSRISVYHIKNGGSSIARNYGLKQSKGDFIGFVDSDDWIQPSMFNTLIEFALAKDLKVVETSSVHSHLVNKSATTQPEIHAKIEDRDTALKRIIANKRFAVWRRIYHQSLIRNRFFIEGVLHQDVYYTLDILNDVSEIGYFENQFYVYNVQNPTSVIRSDYSIKKLKSINAGIYVVENTKQYSNEIKDLAKRYLFEFLTYHYDQLYFKSFLDKDHSHRKNIRKTIKKYHNKNITNFYSYAIVAFPPAFYRIFLFTNKKRIKIQSKLFQLFKNV